MPTSALDNRLGSPGALPGTLSSFSNGVQTCLFCGRRGLRSEGTRWGSRDGGDFTLECLGSRDDNRASSRQLGLLRGGHATNNARFLLVDGRGLGGEGGGGPCGRICPPGLNLDQPETSRSAAR